ncbi:MAG TPA: hypothetical protein VHX68_05890, partial [Planctomycetaceae bacterium]|nr:hypothetical protein [Planctomycetaceae bacterium]
MSNAIPAKSGPLRAPVGELLLAIGLILGGLPLIAFADGGTLRLSETKGPYHISVLTSPNPFRAGPVDVSVIVADAATGDVLPDVKVDLRLAPRAQPSDVRQYPAIRGNAANKLFQSSNFELPRAGLWNVQISVDGPQGAAQTSFEIEAADKLPRWLSLWPWFSWPFLVVGLFAVHQALAVSRIPGRPTPERRRSHPP